MLLNSFVELDSIFKDSLEKCMKIFESKYFFDKLKIFSFFLL